jgi:hypothetical protein
MNYLAAFCGSSLAVRDSVGVLFGAGFIGYRLGLFQALEPLPSVINVGAPSALNFNEGQPPSVRLSMFGITSSAAFFLKNEPEGDCLALSLRNCGSARDAVLHKVLVGGYKVPVLPAPLRHVFFTKTPDKSQAAEGCGAPRKAVYHFPIKHNELLFCFFLSHGVF